MTQRPVRSILGSQTPVSANGEMSVAQAARLMKERRVGAVLVMHEGGFRHMPVVEGGAPLGVVSARDALGPELEAFVAELDKREHIFEVLG